MRKIMLILAVLCACSLLPASTLTLEDAVKAAKENNADYSLALKQYSDSVSLTNRESSLTPSLSLSGSLKSDENFWSTQSGWKPLWNGLSANVGFSASFAFAPSTLNEKKSKEIANELSLLTLESSEDSLTSSVITAYFTIMKARDSIALAESSEKKAEEELEAVRARYEAGLASRLELVQAENSLAASSYTLENYRSSYSLSLRSFSILTGIDVSETDFEDLSSYESEEILSSDELFSRYASSSPSIRSLQNTLKSAELSYDSLRKTSTIPSLTVSAGYTINGTAKTSSSGASDSLSLSAGVSVPLSSYISSSSSSVQLEKAKNTAEDARTRLSNGLVSFRESLDSMTGSLSLLSLQIQNQEKIVSALENECSLTENAYSAGETSLSSLQTARNSLLGGKFSLLSLKYSYIESLYSLALKLGVSYSDLLKR